MFGSLRAKFSHIFRLLGFVGTEKNNFCGLFKDVFVHCGTTHHLYTILTTKTEEK